MMKYGERALAVHLDKIITNLETRRVHYEREYGLYRIEEVSSSFALTEYERTLREKEAYGARNIEPLSSLWCDTEHEPAFIEWTSTKQNIGETIQVKATCAIRPELSHVAEAWKRTGFKLGGSGGVFLNVPNKSFNKIKILAEHPEYLEVMSNLNALDLWKAWWPMAISMRSSYSRSMLELKAFHPDIFSEGNKEAGCGILMHGRKIKRKDLDEMSPSELEWLLDIQAGSALMFAAAVYVKCTPGKKWLVTCQEPKVTGAIGARSDCDIIEASYSGGILTTISDVTCRQIVTDGGGVLSNGFTEKKYFGKSVAAMIWDATIAGVPGLHSPGSDFSLLIDYWNTPTPVTGKKGELVLITNDFGISDPIKSGADQLYSKVFLRIGNKVVCELTSGKWATAIQYLVYQKAFMRNSRGLIHDAIGIGDDFNCRTMFETYDATINTMQPYTKLKGTQGAVSKMLGYITNRMGDTNEIFSNPRVQKTEASASQISGFWAELPERLPPRGSIEMRIPPEIEIAVRNAIPIVKELMHFKGDRKQLPLVMRSKWLDTKAVSNVLEYLPTWFKFHFQGME